MTSAGTLQAGIDNILSLLTCFSYNIYHIYQTWPVNRHFWRRTIFPMDTNELKAVAQ